MKKILIVLSLFLAIIYQARAQNSTPPVNTVTSVDLERYLGKWFEIAAIPQSFEKQCLGNTTADYAIAKNGLISVVNACDTANSQLSVASGRAKVADSKSNAKLKVTFVNFFGWQFMFGGDYWILAIGENYSYAVVGAPGRDYAWILSRTSIMSNAQLNEANQVLVQQGFDTCKLLSTIQNHGLQERTPLCLLVKEQ